MRKLAEIALFTDHIAEMTAFYEKVVGGAPAYKADDIAVFNLLGGVTLLIHKKYPPIDGQPPNENHIAFAADDVAATSAELVQHGMKLLLEPRKYDWGTSAYLRDPDGQIVEIQSVKG
jgi:catechol 2,3-dioxygenase-like lactoylglutathione lyase family enzyme